LRACVIFASRYGNTEKIAMSIESGIKQAGVQAECFGWKEVRADSLIEYDLICVGGPTEAFSASKEMKDFLEKLEGSDLSGKYGFAFDTKLDSRLSGSAGGYIEKRLKNAGLRMVAPRESAIVFKVKGGGSTGAAALKEGEEQRFQEIGKRVGAALLAGVKTASA
jgi:flavodoxin